MENYTPVVRINLSYSEVITEKYSHLGVVQICSKLGIRVSNFKYGDKMLFITKPLKDLTKWWRVPDEKLSNS